MTDPVIQPTHIHPFALVEKNHIAMALWTDAPAFEGKAGSTYTLRASLYENHYPETSCIYLQPFDHKGNSTPCVVKRKTFQKPNDDVAWIAEHNDWVPINNKRLHYEWLVTLPPGVQYKQFFHVHFSTAGHPQAEFELGIDVKP